MGDGATTGTIAVPPGTHTVSESGAPGTSLADYEVAIVCRDEGPTGVGDRGANDPSLEVQVRRGSAIVCVVTNTAKQEPDERVVSPDLECVVFNEGSPDIAVWGYRNRTDNPVTIPVGDLNRFEPAPRDRRQPTVFEPGRFVGVFQTPFEAGSTTLVWSLSNRFGNGVLELAALQGERRAEEGRGALD